MKLWCFLPLILSLALSTAAPAAITVSGISDKETRNNRAIFEVPGESGFTIQARLDGSPIALDTPIEITSAGYYELAVTKTNDTDLTEEATLIRFIVIDTSRGSSERGLATWVPFPTIDSAPGAFRDTGLEVVAPSSLPLGFDIPLITRLRHPVDGKGVRLNGTIRIPESPSTSVRLLRGFGSAFVPAPGAAGPTALTPTVAHLTAPITVEIEPATRWTTVSSDLVESTDWGSDARLHVTTDLTIAAGVTLTIGPGSIVQLDPGVDLEVIGTLEIDGTPADPVYFTNVPGSAPWGGFFLRRPTSVVRATGTIFTGSGADPDWFRGSGYSAHRDEQATFLIDTPNTCTFTDCFFIDLPGQALHGRNAPIELTDSLIQRVPTVGQFNGGSVTLTGSALLEFPDSSEIFADDDNDAIYFTSGSHRLIETVIGWAKDDGVDAGSGNPGSVTVTGCWFESCFHEGMAWSGPGRLITVSGTVAMNCGQAIEAGWSGSASNKSPSVTVTDSLSIGNHIGWRFGDNYTWDYDGQLNVSNSLALHNDRNVWGMEWDSWTYRSDKMTIENNHLSAADHRHPDNTVWDGDVDAALLEPFSPVAGLPAGAGFAEWELQKPMDQYEQGLTLGLSEFSTLPATIDYEVWQGFSTLLARDTVRFAPGEIRKTIALPPLDDPTRDFVRVSLTRSTGSTLTTQRNLFFVGRDPGGETRILLPRGSTWKFLDDGSDQNTIWRETGFDDNSWMEGAAQLGYGDGDETTEVSFGDDSSNKHPTTYFRRTISVAAPEALGNLRIRLLRDDGAIVYLNGQEVFRSNIDPGPINFDTYTENVTSGDPENTYFEQVIPATMLVPGENTIAVEVHQTNATSSDLSFDLELLATPSSDRFLFIVRSPGETNLFWQGAEGETLQTSPSLHTGWTDLPSAASPMVIGKDPSEPRRFFRLAR